MVAVMVLLPPLAIDGGITGRWRTPFSLSDGTFSTHSATTVSAIVPYHIFAHVCKRAGLRGCRGTHGICHRATLNDNRSVKSQPWRRDWRGNRPHSEGTDTTTWNLRLKHTRSANLAAWATSENRSSLADWPRWARSLCRPVAMC